VAGQDWETVTAPKNWLNLIARTGFTDHLLKLAAPS
jgi:hypothetical protein